MREFGRLPRRGEVHDVGRFRFKVLHADSRRIHLLQLTLVDLDSAETGSAPTAAPPR
jgi:magnesium and cobalt transporter